MKRKIFVYASLGETKRTFVAQRLDLFAELTCVFPYAVPLNEFPLKDETAALIERLSPRSKGFLGELETVVGLGDALTILLPCSFSVELAKDLKPDAWKQILPLIKQAIEKSYSVKVKLDDRGTELAEILTGSS